MRIRILQTVASEVPDMPFIAGQVLDVPAPSSYLLSLLDGIRAEAIPTDETERAVLDDIAQPEPVRQKGRRRGR